MLRIFMNSVIADRVFHLLIDRLSTFVIDFEIERVPVAQQDRAAAF